MFSLMRGIIASKADIEQLKEAFMKIDRDNDGFIQAEDLKYA